jgi:hypothetical protein
MFTKRANSLAYPVEIRGREQGRRYRFDARIKPVREAMIQAEAKRRHDDMVSEANRFIDSLGISDNDLPTIELLG